MLRVRRARGGMHVPVVSFYRALRCTSCRELVEVIEIPVRFLDPERYTCGRCLSGETGQLAIEEETRREERKYDPQQSLIPI